ncbi:hypothetical protein [Actinoplanes sp. NPDC049265]|uniref:hypothetical protein n=1 Tax=Actinoplanes sp. NPDC049265 TaxID=3363902 RepID=UPI003715C0ED
MFIAPETLLASWEGFSSTTTDRLEALSRLAARDSIENVLRLRHPSVERFAASVRVVDERKRRSLPAAAAGSHGWWWRAAPPVPVRAPDLGSVSATAVAAEIWSRAAAAGLTPVDRLTFSAAAGGELVVRLRFQVIDGEHVGFRPWLDFVLIPVERDYLRILGMNPPEIYTATVSVAVGRLRRTGIHLPTHASSEKVEKAIDLHLQAFSDVMATVSPEYLVDELLRQPQFSDGWHSRWRLPMALAHYGRLPEARQVLTTLAATEVRAPHSRAAHDLEWLGQRLRLTLPGSAL